MTKTFPFLDNDPELYYHDPLAALRVVDFVEKLCKRSVPRGDPFKLLEWERQIVWDVFGWFRRDNGERRFTNVYIEVPRKNGKTQFVAALALYLLMADGQDGAQVFATAVSREQSGLLYKAAKDMVEQSEFFRKRLRLKASAKEVYYDKTGGVLKALSGESKGTHGKYPSAVVCVELHEWTGRKSEDLYEALTSGWGNRRSPLLLHITTAGYGSQPTLAKRLHEKALKFERGECDDPSFYGVVYGATSDDDWTAETTWRKANPSWDLARKNLANQLPKAKAEPSEENTFKRLYLNIWTQQQTRWLSMDRWDACTPQPALNYADFVGKYDLILGLDLSQSYDLTAISLLFVLPDGSWVVFVRSFSPRKTIEKRSREDAIPYDHWAKAGFLTATEGASGGLTVDYPAIVEAIAQIAQENKVVKVGYDPAGSHYVVPELIQRGLDCIQINQRHNDLTHGTKEFERRLVSGELQLEANPCLRWQAGNVEVSHRDGMIKPDKPQGKGTLGKNDKYKVDGITATVIAAQVAVLLYGKPAEPEPAKSSAAVFFVNR